jgi:predicted nucleic acid-binding Zn finger protein
MTVTSFTDSSKTYETTEHSCTCGDWIYRKSKTGQPCKHQIAIEAAKAVTFQALRRRYDYRLNGDLDSRRCYFEMAIGA